MAAVVALTARRIDSWASTFGTALREIHERSPKGKILVTGYGAYIRPGGCWPTQPVWARDADHLQSLVNRLNSSLRAQAEAHDATYVDLTFVGIGHDMCAAPTDRYIEGLIPTGPATPLHPNTQGMAAYAAVIAQAAR
ncbi:GDSL-type esterase/lipase family protein [Nonomuraea sp. NPDC050783]|uniref:GDSL-type esterase/lipase family protein n=1 Tax=Nonomuraea sp. NPDC050783 TaxID=3154634 RepID=UPI0034651412